MIRYIFLNWKLPGGSNHIYSTEIIEADLVLELIDKLRKLESDYGLVSVYPISQIFDVYNQVELSKICSFLEDAYSNCLIDSESDMDAYRRLLGPDLRHGPDIFREITEISESLLKEGGKYDPVYIIRDYLKDPFKGVSEFCQKAIKEACDALVSFQHMKEKHDGCWTVEDFLCVSGIKTDGIDKEILKKKIYVLQDDGMGYGAINGPCTAIDRSPIGPDDEEYIKIWM